MLAQGPVGEQLLQDGDVNGVRLGRLGDVQASSLRGRFAEAAARGHAFCGANTAANALGAVGATFTGGLVLVNPVGSGFLFELLEICVAPATVPAAATQIVLAGQVNVLGGPASSLTVLTINKMPLARTTGSMAQIGSTAALAIVPVVIRPIGGTAVAAASVQGEFIKDAVNGAVCLLPGSAVGLARIGGALSAISSMTWAEYPL